MGSGDGGILCSLGTLMESTNNNIFITLKRNIFTNNKIKSSLKTKFWDASFALSINTSIF